MATHAGEDPRHHPLVVERGEEAWAIERLAEGGLRYVEAYGPLPTHAAMHLNTGADFDLFARFDWEELLPGASGACRFIEERG